MLEGAFERSKANAHLGRNELWTTSADSAAVVGCVGVLSFVCVCGPQAIFRCLLCHPPAYLRQSLNLGQAILVTGWPEHLPGPIFSAYPSVGGHTHSAMPPPALYGCWGFELRSSGLSSKHFTHLALFPDWLSF